ncbi:MAG TPA: DUF2231 domain-containing protein [Methylococcus sp.]|nr:DUF2231 domain-containing protein [Methylococcus sp.]
MAIVFESGSIPWDSLLPLIHGGGDDSAGGGLLGLLDQILEVATRMTEPGAAFTWFPGVQALASNVHPLIVHFPIAFLIAFFFMDLVAVIWRRPALRHVASWMLYLGAFGAVAAAAAGLAAEATVAHGETVHEILEWHARLGLTVASLSVALVLWRIMAKGRFSSMANAFHLSLGAIVVLAILLGADLGGLMVYQHGVGVKAVPQPDDHHHAAVLHRH